MTVRHRHDSIEPAIFLGRRFIVWRRAHVVFRRTDFVAARNPIHHFFGPVTHPEIRHADQCVVVGLHYQSYIERRGSVRSQRLPVASTRKNLAAQSFAFEAASGDFTDSPVIAWSRADDAWWVHLDLKDE